MTERFGEMRQWLGGDEWIEITSVSRSRNQLLVRTNELFWFDSDGGVLIDTIISPHIDPKLLASSRAMGWVSRDQYRHTLREKRIRECPANVQTITTDANAPAHLAPLLQRGVRFF